MSEFNDLGALVKGRFLNGVEFPGIKRLHASFSLHLLGNINNIVMLHNMFGFSYSHVHTRICHTIPTVYCMIRYVYSFSQTQILLYCHRLHTQQYYVCWRQLNPNP